MNTVLGNFTARVNEVDKVTILIHNSVIIKDAIKSIYFVIPLQAEWYYIIYNFTELNVMKTNYNSDSVNSNDKCILLSVSFFSQKRDMDKTANKIETVIENWNMLKNHTLISHITGIFFRFLSQAQQGWLSFLLKCSEQNIL